MNRTGWAGVLKQVKYVVRTVGGDTDERGEPVIDGIITFMGMTDDTADAIVPAEAVYYKDGVASSLASLMNSTSYGLREIQVF